MKLFECGIRYEKTLENGASAPGAGPFPANCQLSIINSQLKLQSYGNQVQNR